MGRRRVWTDDRIALLRRWYDGGARWRTIARRLRERGLHVSPGAVRQACRRYGIAPIDAAPLAYKAHLRPQGAPGDVMQVENDYDEAAVEAAVQALMPRSPV